jgi:hypothetical protein
MPNLLPEPSIEELYIIATEGEIRELLDPLEEAEGLDLTSNFSHDHIAGVLRLYGIRHGMRLQLGVHIPGSVPRLMLPPEGVQDPIVIWISNNNTEDMELGIYGHWEGMTPRADSPNISTLYGRREDEDGRKNDISTQVGSLNVLKACYNCQMNGRTETCDGRKPRPCQTCVNYGEEDICEPSIQGYQYELDPSNVKDISDGDIAATSHGNFSLPVENPVSTSPPVPSSGGRMTRNKYLKAKEEAKGKAIEDAQQQTPYADFSSTSATPSDHISTGNIVASASNGFPSRASQSKNPPKTKGRTLPAQSINRAVRDPQTRVVKKAPKRKSALKLPQSLSPEKTTKSLSLALQSSQTNLYDPAPVDAEGDMQMTDAHLDPTGQGLDQHGIHFPHREHTDIFPFWQERYWIIPSVRADRSNDYGRREAVLDHSIKCIEHRDIWKSDGKIIRRLGFGHCGRSPAKRCDNYDDEWMRSCEACHREQRIKTAARRQRAIDATKSFYCGPCTNILQNIVYRGMKRSTISYCECIGTYLL